MNLEVCILAHLLLILVFLLTLGCLAMSAVVHSTFEAESALGTGVGLDMSFPTSVFLRATSVADMIVRTVVLITSSFSLEGVARLFIVSFFISLAASGVRVVVGTCRSCHGRRRRRR